MKMSEMRGFLMFSRRKEMGNCEMGNCEMGKLNCPLIFHKKIRISEPYLGPCQTCKMKLFTKIVNG